MASLGSGRFGKDDYGFNALSQLVYKVITCFERFQILKCVYIYTAVQKFGGK